MNGYIYIAGAFKTLDPASPGLVDNDPHFWSQPPTWGICRPDLRAGAKIGDFVFYVLPKACGLPQTIFAYLKIVETISHANAYARPDLFQKRMGGQKPNGNIIVNAEGEYEEFDEWVHKDNVDVIKNRYVVGSTTESRMLSTREIERLASQFVSRAQTILQSTGRTAVDVVSRKGRKLNAHQVREFLAWLN